MESRTYFGRRKEIRKMGRRDTLILSILTLVTAVGWIIFDVYHASVENTIPPAVTEQLAPITPTFNRAVIENLKNRERIEPLVTQEGVSTSVSGSASGTIRSPLPQQGVQTPATTAGESNQNSQ